MFGIGMQELVVILIIVLVLFGGKRLPELSKSIGESLRELRKGLEGKDSEDASREKKSSKKG